MAVRIRLARIGRKKKPFYRIVIANSTSPRDGRFIEKIGTYDPLLDSKERVILKVDRVEHWLNQGAEPSEVVIRFIKSANIQLPIRLQNKVNRKVQTTKPPKQALGQPS